MKNSSKYACPMSDITINQHYVWQHYLRAWTNSKKLWCKRVDNPEPFNTSPRNIGAQRFFYEFQQLSWGDITYLKALISRASSPRLRELNQGWIDSAQMSFEVRRKLNSIDIKPQHREELEKDLRKIEKTLGESLHGATEELAIPILAKLREEDAAFYQNVETRNDFINFISHQYFRTAKMRNIITAIRNPLPHDIARTWPIEAFIYATNLASSLVGEGRKRRIIFLRNASAVPFITGDQPVINLLGANEEEVDLYYPLKSDLAIIFTANQLSFPSDHIDIGAIEVESYNHRIYAMSDSQIYGDDPAYLKVLAKLPKENLF